MTADDARDDDFTDRLAAMDEALAAGRVTPPAAETPRLRRGLAALHALRRAHRPAPHPPTIHRQDTLHFEGGAVGPAPLRLGRFQILHELGRGGFGIVFLAHDPRLGRDVALKVPRAQTLADPGLRGRFEREARAAATLDHPNIVPVYEVFEDGPVCAIAYAFCDGVTLAEWLARHKTTVTGAEAAAVVERLADAVAHAHAHGVIHRDLKPANVLMAGGAGPGIDSEASKPAPSFAPLARITDFGLAKLAEAGEDVTRNGAMLGTPAYMAPEQANGQSSGVGPAADVWALGAILYELLTGRPPFQGESDLDTLNQVTGRDPVPPRQLRPKLPRDLETVCLKCLEKDPARRYGSAAALRDDLQRFLGGQPVVARPIGPVTRALRWCRRRPAVAGLTAALVTAVALGVAGVAREYSRANAERNSAVAASRRADREREAALVEQKRGTRLLGHAHGVLAKLHAHGESLRTTATTQKVGQDILRESLEYYRTLLAEAGDEPALRRDVVRAALSAGEALRDLGRYGEAEATYQQGLSTARALAVERPDDPAPRRDMARCRAALAAVYNDTGRTAEALTAYADAAEAYGALAPPGSASEERRLRAHALLYHGLMADRLNGWAAGRGPILQAAEELEQLRAKVPDDRAVRQLLAQTLDFLSLIESKGGLYADAEAHCRAALELFQRLFQEMERSASARLGLARGNTRLCEIHRRTGRKELAEPYLAAGAAHLERLIKGAPNFVNASIEYGSHLFVGGTLYEDLGRWADAAAQYQKAAGVYEQLRRLQPTDERWKVEQGWAYLRAARALYRSTDEVAAREQLARLRALVTAGINPAPAHAESFQKLLAGLAEAESR
jgi:tetratricopeptide (TPR) repeat protein/tRNA A-37 threonylcarbamoyl transferase component Bud32